MPRDELKNLARISKLKPQPPARAELDVDEQLFEAMLRVGREVEQRLVSLIAG